MHRHLRGCAVGRRLRAGGRGVLRRRQPLEHRHVPQHLPGRGRSFGRCHPRRVDQRARPRCGPPGSSSSNLTPLSMGGRPRSKRGRAHRPARGFPCRRSDARNHGDAQAGDDPPTVRGEPHAGRLQVAIRDLHLVDRTQRRPSRFALAAECRPRPQRAYAGPPPSTSRPASWGLPRRRKCGADGHGRHGRTTCRPPGRPDAAHTALEPRGRTRSRSRRVPRLVRTRGSRVGSTDRTRSRRARHARKGAV